MTFSTSVCHIVINECFSFLLKIISESQPHTHTHTHTHTLKEKGKTKHF